MENNETTKCSQCGAPISENAKICKYCGAQSMFHSSQQTQPQYAQPQYVQPQYVAQPQYVQPQYVQQPVVYQNVPRKSKTTAGVLALLLGAIGVHKFYLGKTGMGILYLVFCWTYIPGIIAFIEGIIYLTSSEENFYNKYVLPRK